MAVYTDTLQGLIDTAIAANSPVLYLGPHEYKLTAQVRVNQTSGLEIRSLDVNNRAKITGWVRDVWQIHGGENNALIRCFSSNVKFNYLEFDGTVNGAIKKAHHAIYSRYNNNIAVENCNIHHFYQIGVWIPGGSNITIRNTIFTENAIGTTLYNNSSWNIGIGNVTDCLIEGCTIVDNNAGGIGLNDYYEALTVTMVTIRGCDIRTSENGTWVGTSGQVPPNHSISWDGGNTLNHFDCVIENNYIQGQLSCVDRLRSDNITTEVLTVRNNHFHMPTTWKPRDPIEIAVNGMKIIGNLFTGRVYRVIANYGSPAHGAYFYNTVIQDNIVNVYAGWDGWSGGLVSAEFGVAFYNVSVTGNSLYINNVTTYEIIRGSTSLQGTVVNTNNNIYYGQEPPDTGGGTNPSTKSRKFFTGVVSGTIDISENDIVVSGTFDDQGYTTGNVTGDQVGYGATSIPAEPTGFAQSLTGWTFLDIGSPSIAGSAWNNHGIAVMALSTYGLDYYFTADEGSFVYKQVSGDFIAIVRVDSIIGSLDGEARGGLMIRESLDVGSRHSWVFSDESDQAGSILRDETDEASDYTVGISLGVPMYVRIVRSGDVISTYYGSNGSLWTQLRQDIFTSLPSSVYFGFAGISHTQNEQALIQFSNYSIQFTESPSQPSVGTIPSPQFTMKRRAPSNTLQRLLDKKTGPDYWFKDEAGDFDQDAYFIKDVKSTYGIAGVDRHARIEGQSCLNFEGNNGVVGEFAGNAAYNVQDFKLEFDIYLNTFSQDSGIIGIETGGGTTGWALWMDTDFGGNPRFRLYDVGNNVNIIGTVNIAAGNRYKGTLTRYNDLVTLTVNGVTHMNAVASAQTIVFNASNLCHVGAWHGQFSELDGEVYHIRLCSLNHTTGEEVAELFLPAMTEGAGLYSHNVAANAPSGSDLFFNLHSTAANDQWSSSKYAYPRALFEGYQKYTKASNPDIFVPIGITVNPAITSDGYTKDSDVLAKYNQWTLSDAYINRNWEDEAELTAEGITSSDTYEPSGKESIDVLNTI